MKKNSTDQLPNAEKEEILFSIDQDLLLEDLYESSSDCIKILDLQGRILLMSRAGRERLEISRKEQYLGVHWPSFWENQEKGGAEASLQDAMRLGRGSFVASVNSFISKEPRWYDAVVTPIRDRKGEINYFLVISREITQQKLKEIADLKRKEAEMANKAKSVFLASVSHELRTPLTSIIGFSDLLINHPEINDKKDLYQFIHKNSTYLLSIIEELLELSRIESETVVKKTSDILLVDELNDIVRTTEVLATKKSLKLNLNLETGVPGTIRSDPTMFKRILIVLIENAIKFTESGEISITASCGMAESKRCVIIDVTDTGIGISPECADDLFIPFATSKRKVRHEGGRIGLGLVLAKELCKKIGGDLSLLSSVLGKGSTFRVRIPVEEGVKIGRTTKAEEEIELSFGIKPIQTKLKDINLLLIEDNIDTATLVQKSLNLAGATVDVANEGSTGLKKAISTEYDLILMDLELPDCDGRAISKSLRSKGFSNPIYAFTAHAMGETQAQFIEEGFDGYIKKPFDTNELISLVSSKSK